MALLPQPASCSLPAVSLTVPGFLHNADSPDHILTPGHNRDRASEVKKDMFEKRMGRSQGCCHGDNCGNDLGTGGELTGKGRFDFKR